MDPIGLVEDVAQVAQSRCSSFGQVAQHDSWAPAECPGASTGSVNVRTLGIALVLASLVVQAACTGPTFDVVESADERTIADIDRGVLFVDASWSMPSMRARGALEQRIVNMPLELVIADIDRSPALVSLPALADKLTGAGESIWVRDGAICFVCTHADCLEDGLASVFPTDPVDYLRSSC